MATSVLNVSGQQQQPLLQFGAAANGTSSTSSTSSVAWWGVLGAVPGALAAVPGALGAVPGALGAVPGAVGGWALWVAGRYGLGESESPRAADTNESSISVQSQAQSRSISVEAAKGVTRRANASDAALPWWRFGLGGARTEFSTNATQLSAHSTNSSDELAMAGAVIGGAATTMDDWAAFQSFGDLDALPNLDVLPNLDALAAGRVVQDVTPPKTALVATNSTAVSWTFLGFRFGGKDNALNTDRPAPALAPAPATATATATTMTGGALIETPLDGGSAATQTNESSALLDVMRRLNLWRPPSAPPPPPPAPPPVQPPSPLASPPTAPVTALPPYARWSQPATPDPFARLWAPPPPPPPPLPPAAATGSTPITTPFEPAASISTRRQSKRAKATSKKGKSALGATLSKFAGSKVLTTAPIATAADTTDEGVTAESVTAESVTAEIVTAESVVTAETAINATAAAAVNATVAPLTSVQRWRLWRGPPELAGQVVPQLKTARGPPELAGQVVPQLKTARGPPELAGQVVPQLKTAVDEESRDDFEIEMR